MQLVGDRLSEHCIQHYRQAALPLPRSPGSRSHSSRTNPHRPTETNWWAGYGTSAPAPCKPLGRADLWAITASSPKGGEDTVNSALPDTTYQTKRKWEPRVSALRISTQSAALQGGCGHCGFICSLPVLKMVHLFPPQSHQWHRGLQPSCPFYSGVR